MDWNDVFYREEKQEIRRRVLSLLESVFSEEYARRITDLVVDDVFVYLRDCHSGDEYSDHEFAEACGKAVSLLLDDQAGLSED